ncbi:hypothetical protein ACFV1W_29110 [Kitasatospora sp. NPDC059648]|uniref:hypothetical protein n=1 Tax=Kitasatospora sp. NPDC059648 TaxID=3346894 RepID=UPI00368D7CCE
MFGSWLRVRARKAGSVMMGGSAVLAVVLAAAWTATVQGAHVARVDDGRALASGTATTGRTEPGGTATTDRGTDRAVGTGTTGLAFTVIPVPPSLTIAKSHTGPFVRGEDGTYTITVGNTSAAGPTDGGTVTVHDVLPAGLAAERITGSGWNCVLATLTCTRSDVLPAGQSYPPVTLKVDVSCDAPERVTNTATVTGGGDTTIRTATDPTTIKYHEHHGHDGNGDGGGDGHDGHDHCDRHDH